MLLKNDLSLSDLKVIKHTKRNDSEFFLQIDSPTFDVGNTFDLSFQPIISGTNDSEITHQFNVILFPIIPQYFHNFFEMFTKVLKLKYSGENFKVVLVFDENYYGINQTGLNSKTDGVFNFLIRDLNAPGPNSAHIKEFFDYIDIEFICLTIFELKDFKPKSCYLFFDNGKYIQKDPYIIIDTEKYSLANFLKVPSHHIVLDDIDIMRKTLPKDSVSQTKKIFISRKKTRDRKYKYESELEQTMNDLGYESVLLEDMDLFSQIKLLQTSSHIVCPYGSALVNTCLLSNKNNILSINYTPGYRVHLYESFLEKYGIPYCPIEIDQQSDPSLIIKDIIKKWEEDINKK